MDERDRAIGDDGTGTSDETVRLAKGAAPVEETAMEQTAVQEPAAGEHGEPADRRRRPDGVLLVLGLLTLAMAVAAFVGTVPDLSGLDARWLLAAGAALVGALLLVSSLRGRQG